MYLKTNPDPDRMCYSHFTVATGYISVHNINPLWLYPLIIPVNFTLPVVNLYLIHIIILHTIFLFLLNLTFLVVIVVVLNLQYIELL